MAFVPTACLNIAEEVRNLAGKSVQAAKEITTLIESSISKAEAGTRIANEINSIEKRKIMSWKIGFFILCVVIILLIIGVAIGFSLNVGNAGNGQNNSSGSFQGF